MYMFGICLLLILIIMLVYLDFAIWYSAWAKDYCDRVYGRPVKKRFRGLLYKLWDKDW